MTSKISPYAQGFIKKLEEALLAGDHVTLSDLAFDAECEGLESQIDLKWYAEKAAIMQNE